MLDGIMMLEHRLNMLKYWFVKINTNRNKHERTKDMKTKYKRLQQGEQKVVQR